ncbi:MAG: sodium:solute symporter family protein [Candidatus Aminicenantes bacterium]|nr:sodium:solute symporter family protein [Candidatus Aminicenantes bacterium]
MGYLILFVAYLGLLLFVGLGFARRMRSAEDFFLAGRRLSGSLVFVSLTASWFGATSILVSTDEALQAGVGAVWIVGLPAVATVIILAVLFAPRLHRLPVFTWSDLVELRYGRTVRHLASGLLVWYMALLAASQMTALGHFLGAYIDLPYSTAVALGTAVVLAYTALGGLRSVVWTDVLQGLLLAAGLAALLIATAGKSSFSEAADLAAASGKAGYFDLFHDFGKNGLMFLSFALAWTISPIALQRIRAAESPAAARRGLAGTAVALLGLYALVVSIGVLAFPLFPAGTAGRPLVAAIAGTGGFAVRGLVFIAVLAAILSTMDTAINAGALVLSRDVIEQVIPRTKARPVFWGRASTILLASAAFLVALMLRSILKTIGLSSEILAEGFFIPGVAMIFLEGRYPRAGLLSVCGGGGFAVLAFLEASKIISLGLPTWPYSLPWGLLAGAAGFAVGMTLDRRARGVVRDGRIG